MEEPKTIIKRLEIVPFRTVFPKEAQHFTKWLEEHIDALSERLYIQLSVVQREKEVGDFKVDILCEDNSGHPVIIENQLERTDHDHLGKLLTYLVNLQANTAIWVSTEARLEHKKVIDWLNEATGEDLSFYLVKVEAVRIDDSPYAPLFTVLSAPDKQIKKTGESKKEWAENQSIRFEFWQDLINRSKQKTKLFANISPSKIGWIQTGAGKAGISYVYLVFLKGARIELYIDYGQDAGIKNKKIFDELYSQKDSIEKEFGENLEWERLDEKRSSRIKKTIKLGGLTDRKSWPDLQNTMIDTMIKFERALKPFIDKI